MHLQENNRTEGKNTVCLIKFILVFMMRAPGIGQQLPFAQDIPLEGVEWYDESIPKPENTIGHQIGTRHTQSLHALSYFRAVTDASYIAVMYEYAGSYQNCPLI